MEMARQLQHAYTTKQGRNVNARDAAAVDTPTGTHNDAESSGRLAMEVDGRVDSLLASPRKCRSTRFFASFLFSSINGSSPLAHDDQMPAQDFGPSAALLPPAESRGTWLVCKLEVDYYCLRPRTFVSPRRMRANPVATVE